MKFLFRSIAPLLAGSLCVAEEERAGLDWWSFQPVVRPEVPVVDGAAGAIDAFVRHRLAEEEMQPAPRADLRTLMRRVHFDLTGLSPQAEEVERFEAQGESAYPALVDRLLASPRFGERWARHWLDVVRFAETNGYERDALKPNIWKYRDWVIEAFNRDMPYDQFVREQVAGDEVAERSESSLIATGMLRAGTWNDEPNDAADYKYERLEDMVDVVSTAFLGITVKCARCHDHKFDPIPQRDYYRLAAAFWPGAIEPRDGKLMGGPNDGELGVKGVFGWTDLTRAPPPLHLLVNGDRHRKAEVVEPGHLSLIPVLDKPLRAPPEGAQTTHRRLQLAEFITERRNPLAARVMMNRVWQQLSGQGIVRTPNNFGFKADEPSHPQLLDWLAAEFLDGGWRLKRMIRQIVLSETYRQASVHPEEERYRQRDSGNRLLWKMNRRRADAEALRDAMLHATGELNLKAGGPSFYPVMAPEVLEGFSRKEAAWTPSPENERLRRSVYMVSKRHLLLPLMTAFDFPNSEKPCGKRDVTTVAPQALAMMNNHFVHARSEKLATLALSEGEDLHAGVRVAWRQALGRDPSEAELSMALEHFAAQRDHFVAKHSAKQSWPPPVDQGLASDGLVLWLSAEEGVELDKAGRVVLWKDRSEKSNDASQGAATRRPGFGNDLIGGKPALRFDGAGQFLDLAKQVLEKQDCTIVAVAAERSTHGNHREIISNWNGRAGNSGSSLFLGLTGKGQVRFSDDFRSTGEIANPAETFLLSASTGRMGVRIHHNGRLLANRGRGLGSRNLETNWVIGQQGNIEGEYWTGDLAEVLVYERQLRAGELAAVGRSLAEKYALPFTMEEPPAPPRTPEFLALASLCHVLLNSNEFLYVD